MTELLCMLRQGSVDVVYSVFAPMRLLESLGHLRRINLRRRVGFACPMALRCVLCLVNMLAYGTVLQLHYYMENV